MYVCVDHITRLEDNMSDVYAYKETILAANRSRVSIRQGR